MMIDLPNWIEVSLAAIAIVAGFFYVGFSRWWEALAANRAAGHLSRHSIDFVTERLEALIDPEEPIDLALRGARATEMVQVFRELEISRVQPKMIEHVAVIRSKVFAINHRIAEVLTDDTSRRAERAERLRSSGRILSEARAEHQKLVERFAIWNRSGLKLEELKPKMAAFVTDAVAYPRGRSTADPTRKVQSRRARNVKTARGAKSSKVTDLA